MSLNKIDRREFLASGLALAGATLLGVSACSPEDGVAPSPPTPSDADLSGAVALEGDLFEPRVLSSLGGILSADITCSTRPVKVAGRQVLQPVTYNGTFPGPTLWVRPGDMVDIRFTNKIVFDQAGTKPGYGRPPRPTNRTKLH